MKSNVIDIFTRQYLEVPETETPPKRRKKALATIENNEMVGLNNKPLFRNTPADLSAERREHNESVKRQYRLT